VALFAAAYVSPKLDVVSVVVWFNFWAVAALGVLGIARGPLFLTEAKLRDEHRRREETSPA